ncbi:MAG: hypothetical protein IT305_13190 [Chloroflexi bacterium]|nr:hypothetical protein [Chloroflexota bacterium]
MTLSETPAHADLGLVEAPKPDDERFFPDTGRRISDDDIWSYYVRNGGVAEFGRPLSDPFLFTCCTMQIFEYASLNVSQPYLGVARMNVLDGDILGVTVLDGVRVPAYDPSIPGLLVPWQSDRACDGGASGFIGQRVGYGPDGRTDAFLTAYLTAEDVANDQAFRLLCLDGLERWGLPTSPAIVNPNGDGGVMQRFQRGVMWFEPDCGCIRRVSFGETLRHVFRGDEDGHPDLARAAVFGLFAPSLLHVGPAVEADRAVGILATGGVD